MADFPICVSCGKAHTTTLGRNAKLVTACAGHISSGPNKGNPCRHAPRRNQRVCGHHGGSKRANLAAAARRESERKAAAAMRRFGGPIDTTPSEALLETVKWTAGYVAWLREKVATLDSDDALVWGMTKQAEADVVVGNGGAATLQRGLSITTEAAPNVWLSLLGEWSDRLVKVCEAAIKAGIEERRVRLAEQQGALVADVIKAILGDLGLTAEQQAKVATVVPARLRGLTAAA